MSEQITGPTIQFYQSLAKNNNIWLSIGGFHELNEEVFKKWLIYKDNLLILLFFFTQGSDKIFNSHLIINDAGELCAKYQKIHLFDVNTPEFKFRESQLVSAGKSIVPPQTTPIGQLGLMIVSLMRFNSVDHINSFVFLKFTVL